MTTTPKQLAQAAIGTGSFTAIYTVPALTTAIMKHWDICNTTSGNLTVRVCIVPNAGSPGTGNAIWYDFIVPGNDSVPWEGEQVMATGVTLQTQGSVAGLTITASGVELT